MRVVANWRSISLPMGPAVSSDSLVQRGPLVRIPFAPATRHCDPLSTRSRAPYINSPLCPVQLMCGTTELERTSHRSNFSAASCLEVSDLVSSFRCHFGALVSSLGRRTLRRRLAQCLQVMQHGVAHVRLGARQCHAGMRHEGEKKATMSLISVSGHTRIKRRIVETAMSRDSHSKSNLGWS